MIIGIKVYKVDGSFQYLQLKPESRLRIQNLFPAFDDKLESGIFSFPIDVPWTDSNRQWLGFIENLNGHNANIPEYWRCDIVSNGITFMYDAKLTMLSHAGGFTTARGDYKFTVSGIKGLFGNLIKGKKLRDLNLEGKVTWDNALDSRAFAFNVMNSQDPANFAKFKFAAVVIENFIDTSRADFNTEFLPDNIVNNTVIDASFPDGWTFGRLKPGFLNAVLATGEPGYADYRTVPFMNFFWVLRQLCFEFGFLAEGSFFNYPDFDKIHIYNTVAIDKYNAPFTDDVNRELTPANHLPDMLISDFLVAIQNSFNLKVDFLENKRIMFSIKTELLTSSRRKNYTEKCYINYDDATRHEAYNGGVKLEWQWDSGDSFSSDKVKELEKLNIVAEVSVYTEIAMLLFTIPIDDSTYVYVKCENYLYNYDTTNNKWWPAIEYHDYYKSGKGEVVFSPQASPMCHYYNFDVFGNINRTNMVAAAQRGNYINDFGVKVENPFGLRFFYIDQIDSGTFVGLPISFCHNYDTNNIKLVDTSLSWLAEDGLYNKLWKPWLDMLINSWIIRARFLFDIVDAHELKTDVDIVINNGNQYLIKQITHDLPITGATEVELVKL